MKKILLFITASIFSFFSFCQNYNLKWGQEIKLRTGTNDMNIVDRDNSGVYFVEGRVKSNRLSFAEPYSTVYKLYKFDNKYSPVFEKNYEKDLKGLDLASFQTLNGDLFMFATNYEKKAKLYKVYGAKINKSSGDLEPGFTELASCQLDEHDDLRRLTISKVDGDRSFLIVTKIMTDTRQTMGINIMDNSLHKKENVVINLPMLNATRDVINAVQYTNGKIVCFARRLEKIQTKKATDYQLKNYMLMVYNLAGVKEKEEILDIDGEFQERLFNHPDGGILVAGFNINREKQSISGFFMQKLNMQTGQLEKKSYKEITPATFLNRAIGNQEQFPDNVSIRSINVSPIDNSVIVTAEISRFTSDTYHGHTATGRPDYGSSSIDYRYVNKEILLINADKDGQIRWVNVIPKSQVEVTRTAESSFQGGYEGYVATGGGMPYYSSYTQVVKNNTLIIVLNDDAANTVNPKYGDQIADLYNFKKTNLYGISVDFSSGKMSRKIIASNNTEDILAPRHSYVVNNEILMPSWREHWAAQTELRLAQITVE